MDQRAQRIQANRAAGQEGHDLARQCAESCRHGQQRIGAALAHCQRDGVV